MRCAKCGNENPSEYSFCGMCGTPLEKPAEPQAQTRPAEPVAPARPVPPPRITGHSFLGLDQPPTGSADYLLEDDEPKRGHGRVIFILLVIVACLALGFWQWRRAGYPGLDRLSGKPATEQTSASESTPQTPAESQPSAESTPATAPATTPPAAGADTQAATTPASSEPAKPSAPETAPVTPAPQPSDATAESASAQPTAKPAKPAKPARTAKPKAAPPSNPDDLLVANAEKYLYGRGRPQNCDRALSALRAAGDRGNARARSLLGTMYATGHCVPKDLPNAYRWFALASHDNTDNLWVQRNLEMIWREMTPQERQLATQRSQ